MAIHNWVQQTDLEPAGDVSPERMAINQKVIPGNDEQYCLYAAVDRGTVSHSRTSPRFTRSTKREEAKSH